MNVIRLAENRTNILKTEKLANIYRTLIDYNTINTIDFKGIEKSTYVFMDVFLGIIVSYKGIDWFNNNIIVQNMSDGVRAIYNDIIQHRTSFKIVKC